ncbi:hypothetical protein D9756_006706 [Leucocoprinus leucothites]|uniref:Uncharacterized protein n=1 Tax=Leucocoprinus leucothites TaxID=201217 RepID=A0A8H5G1V3_9AGAR|nr:hypothetical protein D9756_006706 [Leucoagaricus leucothites]
MTAPNQAGVLDLRVLGNQLKGMQQQINADREEREECQQQIIAGREELQQQIIAGREELQQQIIADREEWQKWKSDMEKTQKYLEEEIASIGDTNKRLEETLGELEIKVKEMNMELKHVKQQLDDHGQQLGDYRQQLSDHGQTLAGVKMDAEAMSSEIGWIVAGDEHGYDAIKRRNLLDNTQAKLALALALPHNEHSIMSVVFRDTLGPSLELPDRRQKLLELLKDKGASLDPQVLSLMKDVSVLDLLAERRPYV